MASVRLGRPLLYCWVVCRAVWQYQINVWLLQLVRLCFIDLAKSFTIHRIDNMLEERAISFSSKALIAAPKPVLYPQEICLNEFYRLRMCRWVVFHEGFESVYGDRVGDRE